jgi:hypothetical protein
MRATERLLEFIGEQTDDPKILDGVAELRRCGDTLVKAETCGSREMSRMPVYSSPIAKRSTLRCCGSTARSVARCDD